MYAYGRIFQTQPQPPNQMPQCAQTQAHAHAHAHAQAITATTATIAATKPGPGTLDHANDGVH